MNILVITRHAPANYGSLLQSIATQKSIEKLGHNCRILDYVRSDETGANIAFTQVKAKQGWNSNLFKKSVYIACREPENLLMYNKFLRMRKKWLSLTKRYSSINQLIIDLPAADVYMTGSDQVWGPISTGRYDPAYFLSFLPETCRKVSYASSFGKTIFSQQTLKEYQRLLQRYDFVTVRENSAVDLVKQMGIEAEQVLDPTLLLTGAEWSQFIQSKPNNEYVLVYQIHNNPALDRYAAAFAEKANLPLIRISPLLHQISRRGKLVYLPDVSKFLSYIKYARFLITDSFHGTAFAINFNTQFVEILPNTGTGSRNQSILEMTGLTDRIVHDLNDMHYIEAAIDYTPVNKILEKERKKSIDILREILINKII